MLPDQLFEIKSKLVSFMDGPCSQVFLKCEMGEGKRA